MCISVLEVILFFLYAAAAVTYGVFFVRQEKTLHALPTVVLLAGLCFHGAYITVLARALGRLPIITVFEVLTSATLLCALVYVVLELCIRDRSLGVLIVPILLVFQGIASAGIVTTPRALPPQLEQLPEALFSVHIVFMLLAYSGFTVAFLAGAMHLLLAREIHQKRLGFFFSRLPSLELLDRLNSMAATLGLIAATGGILFGVLMARQYWGTPLPMDAKFIIFTLTWALYLFHLLARRRLGWQGSRAAWLSVVGFVWVILNFLVVSLFLTKLHLYT